MTPIAPGNILKHELIGLNVKIVNSKNEQIVGIKGKVIDETKNILTIANSNAKRKIPKDIAIFQFKLPKGTVVNLHGSKLIGRPENRLKVKMRKW